MKQITSFRIITWINDGYRAGYRRRRLGLLIIGLAALSLVMLFSNRTTRAQIGEIPSKPGTFLDGAVEPPKTPERELAILAITEPAAYNALVAPLKKHEDFAREEAARMAIMQPAEFSAFTDPLLDSAFRVKRQTARERILQPAQHFGVVDRLADKQELENQRQMGALVGDPSKLVLEAAGMVPGPSLPPVVGSP